MIFSYQSLYSSSLPTKRINFSLTKCFLYATSISAPEKFMTHLQKNGSNVEKSLATVKVKLDASCLVEVLKRCSADKPKMGLRFFIWAGIQPNYRLSSDVYGKACKLLEVDKNSQVVKDVIESYKIENCAVTIKMFKVVLKLCAEAKDANLGLWVLKKMKQFNCRPDTTAYNVVIRLFSQKGQVDEAMGLMREMGLIDLFPDIITYMSMIKGLCAVGRLEEACGLIKSMKRHGCLPNSVVYSAVLDGIIKFGSLDRSLELLAEMEEESGNCKPNVVTYTSLIQNLCEKGQSLEALCILDRMKSFGCNPNRTTMNILIKGLCKDGHLEDAYKVTDKVAGKGVSSDECYSSLVLALWHIGKFKDAEMVFDMMLTRGLRPDGVASSTVLRWLCLQGRFLDAFSLYYDGIEKSGKPTTIDSDIYSILYAGLHQNNHVREAAKVAKLMAKRGIELEASHKDKVVKHLDNLDEGLVSRITGTAASLRSE